MTTDRTHYKGRLLSTHSIEVLRLRTLAQRLKDAQDAQMYSPVAVPTGTTEKPPKAGPLEKSVFLPAKAGEREGTQLYQRREAPKPTLGERLAPLAPKEGTFSLGAGRFAREVGQTALGNVGRILSPLVSALEPVTRLADALAEGLGTPTREGLTPGETLMEALVLGKPIGTPAIGGVSALRRELGAVSRMTTQAAQKAAPVARRLATEEAGAIRLSPEGEAVLRKLTPAQKPAQIKAIQESTALSAEEKATRLKIIEEGPIAKPVAPITERPLPARGTIEPIRQELPVAPVGKAGATGKAGISATEKAALTRQLKKAEQELIDVERGVASGSWSEAAAVKARTQVEQYKEAQRRAREGMSSKEVYDAFLSKPPITEPVASEALSPAAKAAKATEGVIPRVPVGARRTPQEVEQAAAAPKALTEPVVAPTGAKAAAGQVAPLPVSAAPPTKLPTIRRITQPEPGFSVIGVDSQGRKVRAVAPTLREAQAIRANILAGREPFAGAEVQFQQKAVANAERRMKAAIKRGDKGAEQRADVELHELYSTGGKLPPKPPKPPATGPDGTSMPPPSFEGARDKLVKILQTSVRRSNKELEALRAAERKRRAGMVEAGFQRAKAAGEPPIARIRAAQRGEFPTPELELADRLLPEEVSVLRGSIYDTLGPELRQTAANVDEALTRLATEGKLPTPSEVAWMEEIFGPEFVKALLAHRTRGAKALELALGVWNLPRALLASFDDSMVLRQGLHLLPEGAPAGRALKAHIKAITSAGAEEVIAGIRANPWFNHGRARGLDLSLPGVARGLVGREEVFMGAGIAARIPILGRGIRVSERIAEAYLNKLRMETYAAHAQELTRMGASDAAFRELAQNIGILSGRASLGKAQAISPVLNGMFFSARLNWARAQAPFRILRQVPNLGTPEGRHLAKMLAKDVYGVWAGIVGMLGVAAAAGAAVELDCRSSDFGKMQIGTVRVDPWAGQQQFAVLICRLISGEVKTTTTRTVRPQEEMDTLARFIESKFHPALGQLIAVKRGKSYVGEELTVNEYAKQWLPLFVQDIQEITTGTTPGMAAALGTAAFFGVSVYNIPGVPSSVINQIEDAVNQYTAIPADSLELAPGQISRQKFREGNPKTDAALFIAGQVTSLASPAAIEEAARLIKEHGINADDIRGIDQRKERQEQARLAGKYLEVTLVDILINEWLQQTPEAKPTLKERLSQSASTPTPKMTLRERLAATPEPVGAR